MPICLESEQKYTLPHGNVCRIYREISDLLWSFPLYLVFLLQAVLSDWWVIRVLGAWGGLFGFIPVFILGGYICRIANRLAYHEIGVLYLQKRLLRFYFFLIVLVSLTPFFYWFKQRSDVLYFRYVIYVSLILAIYLLIQWGKIICCYDVLLKEKPQALKLVLLDSFYSCIFWSTIVGFLFCRFALFFDVNPINVIIHILYYYYPLFHAFFIISVQVLIIAVFYQTWLFKLFLFEKMLLGEGMRLYAERIDFKLKKESSPQVQNDEVSVQ